MSVIAANASIYGAKPHANSFSPVLADNASAMKNRPWCTSSQG